MLVLRRASIELVLQAIDGEDLEFFNALVALFHFLQTRLVVATRHHLPVLNLHVLHPLIVELRHLDELLLIDPLRLVLAVALAEHLNLEGLLVGVLTHHALELESIAVQLHG